MIQTAITTHAQGRSGSAGVSWRLREVSQLPMAFMGKASWSQSPVVGAPGDVIAAGAAPVCKLKVADQPLGAGVRAITRQK